ncbi:MAG: hypothetical protein ACI4FN_07020 [Acutalibacteraceae bacterium]
MRKSEMLKQNTELFDRLTDAELKINALQKEITERDGIITELKSEIERLNAKLNATEPLKTLEAKVVRQAEVSPEVDYGASVIGKTVLLAAKHCNMLTTAGEPETAKELVNLLLGRTEVAKAEILKITSSEDSFEDKKEKIDGCFDSAAEYFESVMAQRDYLDNN